VAGRQRLASSWRMNMVGDNMRRLIEAALKTWKGGVKACQRAFFAWDQDTGKPCETCLLTAAAMGVGDEVEWERVSHPDYVARRLVRETFGLSESEMGDIICGFDNGPGLEDPDGPRGVAYRTWVAVCDAQQEGRVATLTVDDVLS